MWTVFLWVFHGERGWLKRRACSSASQVVYTAQETYVVFTFAAAAKIELYRMRRAKPRKFYPTNSVLFSVLRHVTRLKLSPGTSPALGLTLHFGKTREFSLLTCRFWSCLWCMSLGFNHIWGSTLTLRSRVFWSRLSSLLRGILLGDLCQDIVE